MFNEKKEAGYVNWTKIEYKKSNIIENKKPILVLMNMNTCSAGESFVKALKTLKNTVFIGTNTSGMENIGNVNGYVKLRKIKVRVNNFKYLT